MHVKLLPFVVGISYLMMHLHVIVSFYSKEKFALYDYRIFPLKIVITKICFSLECQKNYPLCKTGWFLYVKKISFQFLISKVWFQTKHYYLDCFPEVRTILLLKCF